MNNKLNEIKEVINYILNLRDDEYDFFQDANDGNLKSEFSDVAIKAAEYLKRMKDIIAKVENPDRSN